MYNYEDFMLFSFFGIAIYIYINIDIHIVDIFHARIFLQNLSTKTETLARADLMDHLR